MYKNAGIITKKLQFFFRCQYLVIRIFSGRAVRIKLEAKLSTNNHDQVNISDLPDKGLNNLLKLDYVYKTGDIEKKREIISSMYPEKLSLDGFIFRTTRINEAVRLIYTLEKDFG